MGFPGSAISTIATGNMSFTGNAISWFIMCHTGTNIFYNTAKFMSSNEWEFQSTLCPFIPFINMQIGSTNGGVGDSDLYIIGAAIWDGISS
jgi:hypothetical protein